MNNSRIRAHLSLGASLVTLALVGCFEENNITNVDLPSFEVDATFIGRVTSQPGNTALSGASYSLIGTAISGMTNARGELVINGLKEGTFQLAVTSPGHASVTYNFSIIANERTPGLVVLHIQRDIWLYETTATLEVRLLESVSGEAAKNAHIDLAWRFAINVRDHVIEDATVPHTIQTDSLGVATVLNAPAMLMSMTVLPYDLDGDGQSEFRAISKSMTLRPNETTRTTHVLQVESEFVSIVGTNLPNSNGVFSETMARLTYSSLMDLDPPLTVVTFRDANNLELPVTTVWGSDIRLDINLPTAALETGTLYTLTVDVRSRRGRAVRSTFRFRWLSGGIPPQGDCVDIVTDLRARPESDMINYDTRSVGLEWTALACAGGYRVFARDNRNNPEWTFVGDEPTDFEFGPITTFVTLPESFDRFFADAIHSPFAGIYVEFSVVPLRSVTPAPGPPHGVVRIVDNTDPTLADFKQISSGVNFSGVPRELTLALDMSEYVAESVGDPSFEVIEAGGDPLFTINPAEGTWTWNPGRHSGKASFPLLDGQNASGDRIRVVFNSLADLSGNVGSPPARSNYLTIVPASFFDFESSSQGWTRSGNGWDWGTPENGPRSAFSGERVWATTLRDRYGPSWLGRLTSPLVYVSPTNANLTFWMYSRLSFGDEVTLLVDDGVTTESLGVLSRFVSNWQLQTFALPRYGGQTVRIIFEFVSNESSEDVGVFIDDVCVSCSP